MGRSGVDQFARLFVIPQANHGLTGSTAEVDGQSRPLERSPLPTGFDRFAYLVDWVERGARAASLTLTGGGKTLPLCSYPSYPRYTGGPATEASSYRCAEPPPTAQAARRPEARSREPAAALRAVANSFHGAPLVTFSVLSTHTGVGAR